MSLQGYLRRSVVRPTGGMSKVSDLVLAALVVAIIALMILPLPRLMIDVLVALNIAIGVMLVLMGIYVSSVLQFSAFPSVLLISTLFRLALSVATTRMILLHGDAGSIIDTFGAMVAGGNLVVGLVVFLIITLVQFLVIAKGAERVAEVGARFTLDAMPGKQLSIDSDLRSNLIDKVEARRERHELELESKLHGSMDGAMKFVKGDAIAGIVIIIVNLIGGLAIGVFQLGMDTDAAMSKYSILTIGDGLVAQIPALLGAMSAGLIVTRATDSSADEHLGDSIQKQFSAIPRVLLVAGFICFMLGLVPGFPALVFIGFGFALTMSGGLLVPTLRRGFDRVSAPSFNRVMEGKVSKHRLVSPIKGAAVEQAVPLLLEVPAKLIAESAREDLQQAVTDCIEQFQVTSGVPLPEVKIHPDPNRDAGWELLAFEVPIAEEALDADAPVATMVAGINKALRRNAHLFIGLQETSDLLSLVAGPYPDIVKEAVRTVGAAAVASVLRNLVAEDVPIRDVRAILEALVSAGATDKDVGNLTEHARIALARNTCYRCAVGGRLRVITLVPALEDELMKSLRKSGETEQLVLQPAFSKWLKDTIATSAGRHEAHALLTGLPLRRHLRKLIAGTMFELPVLSYNELTPGLELDMADQIKNESVRRLAPVK